MSIGAPSEQFVIERADVPLSNGMKAWFGRKREPWHDFENEFLALRRSIRLVCTDLVCVHPAWRETFATVLPALTR
jgi:hypothetical protein